MAAHVAHWNLAGRTLAPLELNEVLYTLELGIVTAGFMFMSLAVLSVMIFGRFFCSWGCHILALEDLCGWLLEKIGIRPKPVRSRVLLLVPIGAMLYMFIWPHVVRIWQGRPTPSLHVRGDADGWASFITNDFWRNLPGPWVTILTFVVVGFVIVYVLGTRSFCNYACPYGAIFSLADRIAPGKIMAKGDRADCAECGLCTATCDSHIRVHEELTVFGKVVSPACLKDLDCVSVCPNGSIKYGFTTPSLFKSWRRLGRFGVPYDFSAAEEVLIGIVFVASLFVFRGLYDAVPFLVTLGLGTILAYGTVLVVRLFRTPDLRLNNFQLKRSGKMTMAGRGFAALAMVLFTLSVHSGVIRFHEVAGNRMLQTIHDRSLLGEDALPTEIKTALGHFQICERWGLLHPSEIDHRMASLHLMSDSPQCAEPYIRRLIERRPDAGQWRLTLAAVLLLRGQAQEATLELQHVITALEQSPASSRNAKILAAAHSMLGELLEAQGDSVGAALHQKLSVETANSPATQPSITAPLGAIPQTSFQEFQSNHPPLQTKEHQ